MRAPGGDRGRANSPTIRRWRASCSPPSRRRCRSGTATAILAHRLKREIIATKVANRFVNRLGIVAPFALTEEEGAALRPGRRRLPRRRAPVRHGRALGRARRGRRARAGPPRIVRRRPRPGLQLHIADMLRVTSPDIEPGELVDLLRAGPRQAECDGRRSAPARGARRGRRACAPSSTRWARRRPIADRIVRLFELNGAVGLAMLGQQARHRRGPADPRLHQAGRGAGARLGAERRQPFPGARPVGAAADRRPRPRFRAAPPRIPRAPQERRSQGGGRRLGRRPGAAHRPVPPHRRARPHRLGHHRADARPDRHPGAGAARALVVAPLAIGRGDDLHADGRPGPRNRARGRRQCVLISPGFVRAGSGPVGDAVRS